MSGIDAARTAALQSQRVNIISDMRRDRLAWRLTEVPQILTLFALVVGLTSVTGFGVYNAVKLLASRGNAETTAKIIQIFITGSSSLLGFVVFKLLASLRETTSRFLHEERRFTRIINVVRLASGVDDLKTALLEYVVPSKTA